MGADVQTTQLWLELDHLLVQLWESRAIRPKMLYDAFRVREKTMRDLAGFFLPEITGRGIVGLVSA